MESNGARNAIHVSQDTADALIAGGYAHIIKAREDKIEAKGKGKLQTYWIETAAFTIPATSVTSSDHMQGRISSTGSMTADYPIALRRGSA